jgi:sodium-dependent phosphate cotransporter
MTLSDVRAKCVGVAHVVRFLCILYVFLFSIDLMGESLGMLGGGVSQAILSVTGHPVVGLFIGILSTSIVQSSGVTTVTVVAMTGAGLLTIRTAIPIIMGANIGTTVTNMLVSLVHITRKDEFHRAFAGAVVHDLFNIMCVTLFLPLELATHFLERSALWLTSLLENVGGLKAASPVTLIVHPLTDTVVLLLPSKYGLSERVNGVILLLFSTALLFLSLYLIVRVIRSFVAGALEEFFNRRLFAHPGLAFLTGAVFTATIQSSSVTTSLIVPLLGAGVLTIERIFPYVLGANIGSTITAILGSLATVSGGSTAGLTVALTHTLFNTFGTCIFYPLRIVPISLAKAIGERAGNSKLFGLGYIATIFFVIPLVVLLLQKYVFGR